MISVIIPAHNEQTVIARALRSLTKGALADELDVIVVCNGCTDDTAKIADAFGPPVRVIRTKTASKAHALNIGDRAASAFPRVYADADIVVSIDTVRSLASRLERGDVHAVAPTAQIDLTGCSWPVRAFFDIRSRLPSARQGIGGSGVYALSRAGRARFRNFPNLIADDGYVRIHFSEHERETLSDAHSTVFPPRRLRALVSTRTRARYGSFELAIEFPSLWQNRGEGNKKHIMPLLRDPSLWLKLLIYGYVTMVARWKARHRARTFVWERDLTSRMPV